MEPLLDPSWLRVAGAVAASAAIAAGAGALLGRRLEASAEAPDVCERIQRNRGRVILVVVALTLLQPFALAAALGDASVSRRMLPLLVAMLPLLALAAAAGGFRSRRRVLGDNLRFGAWLGFGLRLLLAIPGFWLVLAATPFLVKAAGAAAPALAAGLFALLAAWMWGHDRLLLPILRAQEVQDPVLRERFDTLSARADAAAPTVYVCGPEGGGMHNAAAFPHRRTPRVIFTRALLQGLTPDEAAAVFAHEVAHLEEWDGRKIRRLQRVTGVLVLLAPAAVPLAGLASPDLATWVPVLWVVALVALGVRKAGRNRQHETESDLRAVALCGDPGALKRALAKLHTANGMPRRLRADAEQMASHPSLARRLQAIDRAFPEAEASDAPATEGTGRRLALALRGTTGEALVLEPTRLHHLTGLPEPLPLDAGAALEAAGRSESLRYDELIELQLETGLRGPRLRVQTRGGEVRNLAILRDDVGTLQAWLDDVDVQLAALRTNPRVAHAAAVLAAFCAGFFSTPLSLTGALPQGAPLALMILALVVMLGRRRPWLAALGAMAAVAALPLLASGPDLAWRTGSDWAFVAAMSIGALWCLRLAARGGPGSDGEPGDLPPGSPALTAALLALLALPGIAVSIAAATSPDAGLHLYAIGSEARLLLLPLAGAAGALWVSGRRAARPLAVVLAGLALLPTLAGSQAFLTRLADDPYAANVPPVAERAAEAHVLGDWQLDQEIWGLAVAPGGQWLAARVADGEMRSGRVHHVLVEDGAEPTLVQAEAVAFPGGARALLLGWTEDDDLELRLVDPRTPDQVVWRLPLPSADVGHHWQLGAGGEGWQLAVHRYDGLSHFLRGRLGDAAIERVEWPHPSDEDHSRYVADAAHALELSWGSDPRGSGGSWRRMLWLVSPQVRLVETRWLDPARNGAASHAVSRSALSLDCQPAGAGAPEVLCLAATPRTSWVWKADLERATLVPLARTQSGLGWSWSGRQLAQLTRDAVHLVDLETRAGTRIPLPADAGWGAHVAAADDTVGIAWRPDAGGTRVLLLAAH